MPITKVELPEPGEKGPEHFTVWIKAPNSTMWEDRKFFPETADKTLGELYKEITTTGGSPVVDGIKRAEERYKATSDPVMIFPHKGGDRIRDKSGNRNYLMFPLDTAEPIKRYAELKEKEEGGIKTRYLEMKLEFEQKSKGIA